MCWRFPVELIVHDVGKHVKPESIGINHTIFSLCVCWRGKKRSCIYVNSILKEMPTVFSLRFWCHSPIRASNFKNNSPGQKFTCPDFTWQKNNYNAISFLSLFGSVPLTCHWPIRASSLKSHSPAGRIYSPLATGRVLMKRLCQSIINCFQDIFLKK